jgi:hypothetical protein
MWIEGEWTLRVLINSARVEPFGVLPVKPFDVLDVLAAHEAKRSMKFCVGATLGTLDGVPDLFEKALVRHAMFFESGVPVPPQQALFASKVHDRELDKPCHLLIKPRCAIPARYLLAELVHRVHQDPVLIIHRLYTDNERLTYGSTHRSSLTDPDCLSGQGERQYRFRAGEVRPWFHIGCKVLFKNHFGRPFVTASGQSDRCA